MTTWKRTVERTLLAELTTERMGSTENTIDGERERMDYRPTSTIVMNDGARYFWVDPHERYRLASDGTGWRVTCEIWDNHVRRLATEDGAMVRELPGVDGPILLDDAAEYEITMHEGDRTRLWLYRID